MANLHSFPASQKLKSRKVISKLFESGKQVKAYPIRAVYSISEFDSNYHTAHVQMGISVPKRLFRSAVDRNRIKRQMKEAYRMYHTELSDLAEKQNIYLAMMVIYIDRKEPDFNHLIKKVKNLVDQFYNLLQTNKS